MKYIFIVGAPGSKWSSVAKNIYYSPSIDRSDYNDARVYSHNASGTPNAMHVGAYFDPGMEFGQFFDTINTHNILSCETEFNRPFTGKGIRVIKSHVLSNHIDFLKRNWPDCPVILVHRNDDSCLGWWVKCGHFNISYPRYDFYYKDLLTMSNKIAEQNSNILTAWNNYSGTDVNSNIELCDTLRIEHPPVSFHHRYKENDIKVKII